MKLLLSFLVSILVTPLFSQDTYLQSQIELTTPKKDNKRSREGGLNHVPVRIWIPGDVAEINGLIVNPFYTKAVTQKHWQAACRQWKFGILAANLFGVKNNEFREVIDKALFKFSKDSQHPELIDAKLCPLGMSAGAGMTTRIGEFMPDRVIAMGPVCLEVGPRNLASMNIPTMTIFGERDGIQYEKLTEKLKEIRKKNGLFSIAVQWKRKHEFARANNLLIPLFDASIKTRLQNPKEPLNPFPFNKGWLGEINNWESEVAVIAPYNKFRGDKSTACWFPDSKTAHTWRAFVTKHENLKLKNSPGLGDGQPLILRKINENILVEIEGEPDSGSQISVYSGDKKLGELDNGKLEIKFNQAGFYPIYLRSVGTDGKTRLSRPNTIIVE